MADKYSAVWVSHSSLNDFLTCPQLYYLKNVYKRPETGHKMTVMTPALALGQAVHDVLESLSTIPTGKRFAEPLMVKLATAWEKVSGKRGGFSSEEQEAKYRQRAEEMIRRVEAHPGPLRNLAVKINMDLPHYWLSEEDQIILCGKIDWLEYLPDVDQVNILDFKTGKNEEKPAFITAKKHLEQVQSENIKNILASLFEILHSHETLLQEIEESLDQLQEDSEEEDEDYEVCETFAKRKSKN